MRSNGKLHTGNYLLDFQRSSVSCFSLEHFLPRIVSSGSSGLRGVELDVSHWSQHRDRNPQGTREKAQSCESPDELVEKTKHTRDAFFRVQDMVKLKRRRHPMSPLGLVSEAIMLSVLSIQFLHFKGVN